MFFLFTVVNFQVETVAQFGVIFLLFALGLEFSTAKVGFCFLKWRHFVVISYKLKEEVQFNFVIAASHRSSCCSVRGVSPDNSFHVFVWNNSLGMQFWFSATLELLL